MKNAITTLVGIIAFFAIVAMMAACNESAPVGCVDNWDEAYDAGMADERAANLQTAASADAAEEKQLQTAETDWQFLAETCEQELLSTRANAELIYNQYDGLSVRSDEAMDALLTLPQESVDYACSRGIWKPWLCDYLNYVNN